MPEPGRRIRRLSDAERAYVEQGEKWDAVERGYTAIQSTKRLT